MTTQAVRSSVRTTNMIYSHKTRSWPQIPLCDYSFSVGNNGLAALSDWFGQSKFVDELHACDDPTASAAGAATSQTGVGSMKSMASHLQSPWQRVGGHRALRSRDNVDSDVDRVPRSSVKENHRITFTRSSAIAYITSLARECRDLEKYVSFVKKVDKKPSYRWGTARRGRASWNLVKFCTNVDDLYLKRSETRLLPIRL